MRDQLAEYAGAVRPTSVNALFIMVGFVLACVLAVKGYQLAALLGRSAPAAWAIGIFIPIVNLISLLSLSSASQAFCKQHGTRVGFLGPDLDDVARLERDTPAP